MAHPKKIAVIGAGISGLTAAYQLKKAGHAVSVFERSGRTGGVIRSEKVDGHLIEHGPNSMTAGDERVDSLISELGLQKLYANPDSRNRYVLRDGKLQKVPLSPLSFLSTGLLSWRAKIRLLQEFSIRPSYKEELSLAEFFSRRFGQEVVDYALNPFVAGVYAGDPEKLSASHSFPILQRMIKEHGSILKGGFKQIRKRGGGNKEKRGIFSFRHGMQQLPDALAAELGSDIHLNTGLQAIEPLPTGFRLALKQNNKTVNVTFDALVLSVPTYVLAELFSQHDNEAASIFSDVYYPPLAIVHTGFDKDLLKRDLDGFGFLVPEKEKRNILGCIWASTLFPGRAPEGKVLLSTFIGGARQPELAALPDAELIQMATSELADILGVRSAPSFTRIVRWQHAIPQYAPGYGKVKASFDALEKRYPGLYFVGNYRQGVSVGDSMASGILNVEF